MEFLGVNQGGEFMYPDSFTGDPITAGFSAIAPISFGVIPADIVDGEYGNTVQESRIGFLANIDLNNSDQFKEKLEDLKNVFNNPENKKLNELNIHEVRDLYNSLTPVLDYNREHYLRLFKEKQPVELLHKINSFVND